jgi:prepilin-type processing-associated H-X9-DG protein
MGSFQRPAETLLLADSYCSVALRISNHGLIERVAFANNMPCHCGQGDFAFPEDPFSPTMTRHNEGANIGYADGHMKWSQWNAIRVPPWGNVRMDPNQN